MLLFGAACTSAAPRRLVVVSSPLAQTVSLLGDTLYGLPRSGEGGPARARNMADARDRLARDSSDLGHRISFARATAEMGNLRDAVNLYSWIAQTRFDDPRVFRDRGELLLRLRQFDAALADLRRAGLLLIGRNLSIDPGPIGAAEDGGGYLTTLQFQIFYLQGLALYCKADYSAAAPVLLEAVKQAQTSDDRVRAMLWLFFSSRRIGDGSEAARVLDLVPVEWAQLTAAPELELLLALKGAIPTDSIRARALGSNDETSRLFSYALGFGLLLRPDRKLDAELWLERAHTGSWDSITHVVAEAELARLQAGGRMVIR